MIVLTDTATDKVRSLMEQEGVADLALRVAVRPGGCSGFSYEMFFDTDVAADDQTLDYSGVKVVVDPSSAMLLEGATLDYKDGLQGAGFAIDNPNAQRTCGCGQSFSLAPPTRRSSGPATGWWCRGRSGSATAVSCLRGRPGSCARPSRTCGSCWRPRAPR